MNRCKCGSYAINHHLHGRNGSDLDLCDVCYWRKRAATAAQEVEHLLETIRAAKDCIVCAAIADPVYER